MKGGDEMKKTIMAITIAAVLSISFVGAKASSNEQASGDYQVAGIVRGA